MSLVTSWRVRGVPIGRIALLGIFALAACQKEKGSVEQEKPRPIAVKTLTLNKKSFADYGEYLATLEGVEQAHLIAYNGGRVAKVLVNAGDKVEKGQKLCDIEGQTAEVQLQQAKLAQSIAYSGLERKRQAYKKGTASKLGLDQAEADFLQAKERAIQVQKAYEGAFCVSPLNGTVVDRHINNWEYLTPGSVTYSVADLREVKATFGIPENEIGYYSVDGTVQLSLASFGDRFWEGRVTTIAKSVDQADRTFRGEALITNPGASLLPGLTGRIKIAKHQLDGRIVVPVAAVLIASEDRYVYVVKDGVAQKRMVKVEASNKKEAVIETGLDAGDELIVAGQLLVGDGAPVRVLNSEAGSS